MPETVYTIISEFEVDNAAAIDNLNKQTKATEDLSTAEKTQAEKLAAFKARKIGVRKEENAEVSKGVSLLNSEVEASKRATREVGKLINSTRQKTLVVNSANRSLAQGGRVLGTFSKNIGVATTSVRGIISKLGLWGIALAIVFGALRRVEGIASFFADTLLKLNNALQVSLNLLGDFLTGDFGAFSRLNDDLSEANELALKLRDSETKLAIANEDATRTIALLGQEIAELVRKRKELEDLDQSPGTLQRRLNFIKDEIELRQDQVKIELERIAAARQAVIDQERLNQLRGVDSERTRRAEVLALIKLENEEIKVNESFNNAINNLLREQVDLTKELREEIRLNLIREAVSTLDFNLVIRDPEKVAEELEKQVSDILDDVSRRIDLFDIEFGRQFLAALNAGLGPEQAALIREDNIFEATVEVLEQGRKELRQILALVRNDITQDTAALAGKLPEFFTEAEKVIAEELKLAKEQGIALEQALINIDKRLNDLNTKNTENAAKRAAEARQQRLEDVADTFAALTDIFGGLTDAAQQALDKQNNLIEGQIDLIERLKENTLEANSDIIASEEAKLSRLLEGRRKYTNQIRELSRLEFVASTASAIAQAAASGPLALPQILGIVAAVISGLAKLKSAATFHEGTESVGSKDKYTSGALKSDEVYAKLQKKERVLSVKQNARVANLSNWELVKAGEMYSANFANQMVIESKYDRLNNKLLKDIREGLTAMQFHVNMDQRGFSAGLHTYMKNQSKIQEARR